MAWEIERKFLLAGEGWRAAERSLLIRQGYLSTDPDRVVRVRLAGERAYLTVKGRAVGARRTEIELEIPPERAREMLELAKGCVLEKRRHIVRHGGFDWEIDEYLGDNAGLVIAELEVSDEADFARALADAPSWLGRDVSADRRLSNSALAERPFRDWSEAERRELSSG
jgi:adenylate cyclase